MSTNKPGYMGAYYRKNKEKFNSPAERKKRAKRNKARRMMIKAGKLRKGSKLEVDHKKPLSRGGSNTLSNLRAVSRTANRSRCK